jgi:hypothetical protein
MKSSGVLSLPFKKIVINLILMKNNLFILLAVIGCLGYSAHAQTLSPTVVSSSGGYFTSASASLSFTVAEMTMVQTFTTAGNILTQGFQQPEDLNVGILESTPVDGSIVIYPNPTNGLFSLQYSAGESAEREISIYNGIGQIVLRKTIQQVAGVNKVDFDLSIFCQGMYMVELLVKNEKNNLSPTFTKLNLIR